MHGACSALVTGRPGIAVFPGMAQTILKYTIGPNVFSILFSNKDTFVFTFLRLIVFQWHCYKYAIYVVPHNNNNQQEQPTTTTK